MLQFVYTRYRIQITVFSAVALLLPLDAQRTLSSHDVCPLARLFTNRTGVMLEKLNIM